MACPTAHCQHRRTHPSAINAHAYMVVFALGLEACSMHAWVIRCGAPRVPPGCWRPQPRRSLPRRRGHEASRFDATCHGQSVVVPVAAGAVPVAAVAAPVAASGSTCGGSGSACSSSGSTWQQAARGAFTQPEAPASSPCRARPAPPRPAPRLHARALVYSQR